MRRGPSGQVRALLALRWQMIRSGRRRVATLVLLALLPALGAAAVVFAMNAPRDYTTQAGTLAPTAYLAMIGICVLAPLSAGGGNELFPPDQLVAYPIRPTTGFHASLMLAPLNLAWAMNAVGLVGLTVYTVPPGPYSALAVATVLPYIAMATLVGWAIAWMVLAARQTRPGRRVVTVLALLLTAGVAYVVATDRTTVLLDQVPTRRVVFGLLIASRGNSLPWARRMAVVVAIAGVAYLVGRLCFRWAAARPSTARVPEDGVRRRRLARRGPLRELISVDHASVWRSTPLRRGLIVLAAAPGALAAALSLQWWQILLLPGLAAAGSALLFGVNAFCLDGGGIVWLASQPQRPMLALWSKAIVSAEVSLVAVLLTVGAAAVRAATAPTRFELSTLAVWCVVVVLVVLAVSLDLSVARPHRADLRGPRDTPAPPGVMAVYSMRLAVVTTMLALFFSAIAQVGSPVALAVVAVPVTALGLGSLAVTFARWRLPANRAKVVSTVSAG